MSATPHRTACLLAVLCCTLAVTAPLAADIVYYDEGERYDVEKIQHVATGADMVGMRVEVWSSVNESPDDVAIWEAAGEESGAAFGDGWSLTVSGDTWYDHNWVFTNETESLLAIRKIRLDGGVYDPEADPVVRDTIFDITWGGDPGTEGSAGGKTFLMTGGSFDPQDVAATYRDIVALEGEDPVGDVWRSLEIAFTGDRSLYPGETFTFQADTDVIPAPGAMVLGAIGLGLVAWVRRRMA